ncbi:MAG: hypothetical protein PUD65_00015 [Spirochaetales bacterium]|nr:hypothetical protein [Spirochaetales bacterium]
MKKLRSIVILLILILVPMSILSAEKIDEEKYRTYFLVESENEYNDHVRIDYSFRGERSSVVVSDGGIEVARFTYLKEDEISSILSKSWILDVAGYDTSDHLTTARTVVEAIRNYLDSRYPYTGNLTAETANAHFSDTISFVLTPYQNYSVTYFQVLTHITPDEVNYFSATYSAGADIAWDHRFTKDFGVGATCGINATFGEGETFLNISPMFQMKAAMFRLGTIEFTTRMGFGGYITINENSVSFVPGIRASLGLNITVSPNISFIIESGLDVGLWLWRSMSSEGFMLAMQKPISLGVGVRI